MRNVSGLTGPVIWLGLVLFIGHELDAVARHEWRLLPGFSLLEDGTGRDVFVLLHIPLLTIVFWFMTHPVSGIKSFGRAAISGLLTIHGGLHFALADHQLYEFQGLVALLTIYGAAVAGAVYLVLAAIDPD